MPVAAIIAFFCALSLASVYQTLAAHPDEIKNLPGLTKDVKFAQYSGYVNATGNKKLHYWFVESQGNPKTDPVILWLNGGPGCSSLDGYLSENGPYHVNDDGSTLYENPYSWNRVANVVYLESPAGVGFSYSTDKDYATSDDQVATDNLAALKSFFVKFPQFLPNDFYIVGESYGGYYVPTLAVNIMKANTTINFKGFGIGNGLSSREMNANSAVYYGYYHGLFGDDIWKSLNKYCCSSSDDSSCQFAGNEDTNCQEAVSQAMHFIYDIGLNEYALYRDCAGGLPPHFARWRMAVSHLFNSYGLSLPAPPKPQVNGSRMYTVTNKVGVNPPCINATAQTAWLNRPDVRKALHIPDFVQQWALCSEDVGAQYKSTYSTMRDQYLALLPKYRALVYNGDTDMACNFLGDQWFVESLQQPVVAARKPWTYSNQVAGFIKQFQNLTFLTVKGAGHMVPQWAPGQALSMITNFLQNTF
ncbi:CTSA [Branchiostoma lanceolatum]|uniref:Carboxypeptidase n=1 Tax=Branchiostoma lanceolatum TaxID=7740 RepID=A0A8K0A902_BRALA|nr:CTSA [Branchiostoma lanceolatum]